MRARESIPGPELTEEKWDILKESKRMVTGKKGYLISFIPL